MLQPLTPLSTIKTDLEDSSEGRIPFYFLQVLYHIEDHLKRIANALDRPKYGGGPG